MEKKNQNFVYGLVDPRDQQFRYIGATTNGKTKPRQQWLRAMYDKSGTVKFKNWVKDLYSQGLRYEIVIVKEFEPFQIKEMVEYGCAIIKYLIDKGIELYDNRMEEFQLEKDYGNGVAKKLHGYNQINKIMQAIRDNVPCYLSDKEISKITGISVQMVKTYLGRMYKADILESKKEYRSFAGRIQCNRLLKEKEHAIPESKVSQQDNEVSGSGTTSPNFKDLKAL